MSRPSLIMGNWKMSLSQVAAMELARELVRDLADAESANDAVRVVLCPSPVHIAPVATIIAGSALELGAQDCTPHPPGAFTGGTSTGQLGELGVSWVLVGHSERRAVFGEDDALLAQKFAAVLAAGLRPVLCVGETLAEREAGQTAARISSQIDSVLPEAAAAEFAVAYEPVWAIGTGVNARLEDVVEVHALIRERLDARGAAGLGERTPILYGGSVNETNAAEYFGQDEVDGALVGGASLDAVRFGAICSEAV
ncbi:triose-phosphate isomerase [bacterium]|nr:MAG: triose-phosphate isomerase [bacterium]RKZ16948.1 MAG: triose-phosphate isomerase [bacterium]